MRGKERIFSEGKVVWREGILPLILDKKQRAIGSSESRIPRRRAEEKGAETGGKAVSGGETESENPEVKLQVSLPAQAPVLSP